MASPPAFGRLDFQQALARLAPRGRIWRTDPDATFFETLGALAPTYERSTEAAARLLIDANPTTTDNLLPEWEASLGLPDPCTPANPSLIQRQAAVRAKWGARGSLTPAYFIRVAASLGFTITITEFRSFRAGSACGTPLYGPPWNFVWEIGTAQVATYRFSAGHSAAGDPLATYDAPELVCRLTRDAPGGTIVIFNFAGFANDGGLLVLPTPGAWPIDPTGLPAGAVYLDSLAVAVVPGVTPNPAAPPVYFGQITPTQLLALGGGDLPLSNPGVGTLQLWNNGGLVCIA